MKIAFGLALASQASAAECPEGWPRIWNRETTEYYNLCWKHLGSGSFNDAVEKCAAVGAGLPLPKNARENEDFAKQYDHIPTNWLGVTWQPELQTWTDLKGNQLTYQPWADSNPQLIPSADNNLFNAAHQVSSLDKLEWKNLPAGAGSEIICVMELEDDEPEPEPKPTDECPEGWPRIWNRETTEYYDLCWKHMGSGSFHDAVEKCAAVGAGLPTPANARENEDFAKQYDHIPTNWLGVTWQQESQTWTDLEGKELAYQPWADSNPQLIPSADNNVFDGAHQVESLDKLEWKNLPAGAGSEIICVLKLNKPEPTQKPTDEPSNEKGVDYRPGKIRDDILQVLVDSNLAETKLYDLVNKRVSSNKGKMITQYFTLAKEKECTFPDHWNWEEYQNSEFNPDRYNQNDPCKAINQLFLALDRWMQIFTRDCTKSKEKALKFAGQRNKQLTRVRNRVFVRMECTQFINKYDL